MGIGVAAKNVRLKRAYASPSAEDGTRVLVDRLWPRGVKRADAAIDHWVKDLSPSTSCGNGSDTIPPDGRSFTNALQRNCAGIQ
ncbi:MAG TPA: DUF488 family protein [Amaricoccus sp.]|nr:DUF488 family protein [Amaricoccus sp.]HMQ91682.1 DUF488 family protein [Amaricoccus sp.]HMR36612.1 DUF488 family protein [Paracoccus sp. (in: a-proteobacteria)]HMR52215.1 DUF488 family protein [Amaricoccus sp.]HMT99067.1 DUF488 family protein [Amaricoccus sp.]